ncbi:MAG: glycosyltransferase [Deltaproteobacteria bacterium]|nr:glycosyltransferase [Deltaproteobacteria bacterium]
MIDTHRANPVSRNAPVRILHLITTLDVGGAEVMLLRLLAALDPERFSNRVVCMAGPGEIGGRIEAGGIPVTYLRFRPQEIPAFGIGKWFALLRAFRPDILQAWMYHANVFSLSAYFLRNRPRLFWNIQASGRSPSEFKPFTRDLIRVSRYFSGCPEAVIINSRKGVSDHMKMGYRREKIHYIPNGFDLAAHVPPTDEERKRIRQKLNVSDDAFCVGMFARYHPVKDHRSALLAARFLREWGYRARFFFAGAGVDPGNRAFWDMVSGMGLAETVRLLGFRRDVPELMSGMDTVISCSRSEGLSNVIGEAMATGIPCVVTDVGDSARIVGNTGRVVPPGDPAALALALAEIMEMPHASRNRLGNLARERIRSGYSMEMVAKAYADRYECTDARDAAGGVFHE